MARDHRFHVSSATPELQVKYCLNHTQIDSAPGSQTLAIKALKGSRFDVRCDLLRETKTWQWGSLGLDEDKRPRHRSRLLKSRRASEVATFPCLARSLLRLPCGAFK